MNCLSCGKQLVGRQRKWCSEACRKRFSRQDKKRSSEFERLSGLRPGSPDRRVSMTVIIQARATEKWLYASEHGIILAIQSVMSSDRMISLIQKELEYQIPGYVVKITILRGQR